MAISPLDMTEGGPAEHFQDITESVDQLNLETNDNFDDVWGEDDDGLNDAPGDARSHASGLSREWNLRYDHFHKMGYREGITEGKKDSAQEGFNAGFRESVHAGYQWGNVRGISSAFASLPDKLKEKLIGSSEIRGRFQSLYDSVKAISTNDALKTHHDSIQKAGSRQSTDRQEGSSSANTVSDEELGCNRLDTLFKEMKYLVETPESKVKVRFDQGMAE